MEHINKKRKYGFPIFCQRVNSERNLSNPDKPKANVVMSSGPKTNLAPSAAKARNVATCSPIQLKATKPKVVRRTSKAMINCRANPQRTGRHLILSGWSEMMIEITTQNIIPALCLSFQLEFLMTLLRNFLVNKKLTLPRPSKFCDFGGLAVKQSTRTKIMTPVKKQAPSMQPPMRRCLRDSRQQVCILSSSMRLFVSQMAATHTMTPTINSTSPSR